MTILNVNDYASAVYFIISGIVRGYYLDSNGKEATKCFSAESDLFSTEGFRLSIPATFAIECVENGLCIKLPYKLVNDLIEYDNKFGELQRHSFLLKYDKECLFLN